MSRQTLLRCVIEALNVTGASSVEFVWHGGEPTLVDLDFYKDALWLQEHCNVSGLPVRNSIQTNATLIDHPIASFFSEQNFSVGVSLDGDQDTHDSSRVDSRGVGTWERACSGIALLREYNINFGVLVVVGAKTVGRGARRLLQSLVNIGVTQAAFLNSLPPNVRTDSSTTTEVEDFFEFETYAAFLCELYDEWQRSFADRLKIREFDSLERIIGGTASKLCVHKGRCMGQFLTFDPAGDVSACDKYVGDSSYRFGNIHTEHLNQLLGNSRNLQAAKIIVEDSATYFLERCKYATLCGGGCPHDQYVRDSRNRSKVDCCGLEPLIATIMKSKERV